MASEFTPLTANLSVRMSEEMRKRINAMADRDKKDAADIARECIEKYLPVIEASPPSISYTPLHDKLTYLLKRMPGK